MIGKLSKGANFAPLLRYLFRRQKNGEPRGVLLGGTLGGESPEDLTMELRSITRLRSQTVKPVRHLSLSLLPGESLTREEWLLSAAKVAEEMGWDSYAVVQHLDRAHEHIHIVASRVRSDGSLAREHLRDFRKVENALREIEEHFRLIPVASPIRGARRHGREIENTIRLRGKEKALAERTQAPTKKQVFRSLVDQSIAAAMATPDARFFPRFLEELKSREVIPALNIRGARITGITFEHKGERMKGSDLGRPYSFASLAKALGYDPSVDLAVVSLSTFVERANQHIRSQKHEPGQERSDHSYPGWSARASRASGSDPELGNRMVEASASGAMEQSTGMAALERDSGQAHGHGAETHVVELGDGLPNSNSSGLGAPDAEGVGTTGSSDSTSPLERESDLCGGNPIGTHSDGSTADGSVYLSGKPNSSTSGTHGGIGRASCPAACDTDAPGGQRSLDPETGQILGMGSPIPAAVVPPMDPRSLHRIAEHFLPKLSRWFSLVSRQRLVPEIDKTLVAAHDGSWQLSLDPCHPEELPQQVERLAEQSLASGTDTDRDVAYWAADDAIREAYLLSSHGSQEERERGFIGWISSRFELVRAGWQRLLERSVDMAARVGDPVDKLETEGEARHLQPKENRWREIRRLEEEIESERQAKPKSKKEGRSSGGFTR